MVILGLDPGYAILGYGLVESDGIHFSLIDVGVIRTSAGIPLPQRLVSLYNGTRALMMEYSPQAVAVEKLFFGKNVKTAIDVGQARGAILVAGAQNNTDIFEYTPLQVKQAIVGYGRAEKQQVELMVCQMLGLTQAPKPDDAADALAIAICHGLSMRSRALLEYK